MAEIRVFVLDSKCGRNVHGPSLGWAAEALGKRVGKDIEIRISEERMMVNLPRDYDLYLLHLSNTTEQAILDLREDQPWSRIDGVTGATDLPEQLRSAVDRIHYIILSREYEEMIQDPRRRMTPTQKKENED